MVHLKIILPLTLLLSPSLAINPLFLSFGDPSCDNCQDRAYNSCPGDDTERPFAESRTEVQAVSGEPHVLGMVLDMLEANISSIIENCNAVVVGIIKLLEKHKGRVTGRSRGSLVVKDTEAEIHDAREEIRVGNEANRVAHAAPQQDTRQILAEIERLTGLLATTTLGSGQPQSHSVVEVEALGMHH
ncbi:hypothetical protein B0T14DRAFT_601214 [Immersiella caudata]|uniref:Uncharacterized protein n=1 Tax=Immersiella caudata TaxID=314043 RepID=A0AA40C2I7_9PEZI|nr:hypothetical protein B0T14DRAFT_601214 [Immersiella caudata]